MEPNVEVEVKFLVDDLEAVRRRLVAAGATTGAPRVHERNVRFDTADGALLARQALLRLRQDSRVRLTYKGLSDQDAGSEAKIREEIELTVEEFDRMALIFARLGFGAVQSYEKYRQTFHWRDVEVVLDEMPFGNFVELEGGDGRRTEGRRRRAGAGLVAARADQLPGTDGAGPSRVRLAVQRPDLRQFRGPAGGHGRAAAAMRRGRGDAMTERPDLSQAPADVVAYVEALEAELARLRGRSEPRVAVPAALPDEPPSPYAIVTISRRGAAKRTPRHLYGRQRRGGMGVFDLDAADDDAPSLLAHVGEADTLLLFTSDGRAFRLPAGKLPESPVRARGMALADLLPLRPGERVVGALSEGGGQYIILLSQRGWVRRVRASYLGGSLIPGTSFHDLKEGGPLVAAAWSGGGDDLFLASREGKAIRFMETQVPARGCLGIRLDVTDAAVAVTAVRADDGVFLLGGDGQGTVRLMSGFAANKAPAAAGKVAMKTEQLVGAARVRAGDELFIISRLGKLIRFAADEIPAKEGVVQGVACMALRADEATAITTVPADSL
ncbi:MAG: CYTH domain-containing protein [Candidatus Promineofilum sp.]|nr:CYTH domain-containing protein [Promineifilum sp.]